MTFASDAFHRIDIYDVTGGLVAESIGRALTETMTVGRAKGAGFYTVRIAAAEGIASAPVLVR